MFKRFLASVAALGLLLAMAVPASAITWGQYDGEAHPYVVNLLFVQNGDGYYSCTGTLLSSTVVLTAGHCTGWLDESGNLHGNDATYVTNAPDIWELYDATRANYPSTSAWIAGEMVSGTAVPHPDYADYAGFPETYDIGLVLLDEPIELDAYGTLPTEGQFEYLRTAKGPPSQRMVMDVGYGLVGSIPAFADDSVWQRRFGYSTIINTGQSANAGWQNLVFTNNPGVGTGGSGTCSGDSGGPAFWVDPATGQATTLVVAVNSYGIAPNCNGNDYQFRTDTDAGLDFVLPYLYG